MSNFTDHASLISALGGGSAVGEALNEKPGTVRAMAARNRIPLEYWPDLIAFAASKGISVTAEWLMNSTPPRKRQEIDASQEAAA